MTTRKMPYRKTTLAEMKETIEKNTLVVWISTVLRQQNKQIKLKRLFNKFQRQINEHYNM